jgi:hypothetical protein
MGNITKAEIKRRLDERDAKNRVFFLYEFIQRAENGGSPVPNEANLGHGEPVYVVKKRDLMEFALGMKGIVEMLHGKTIDSELTTAQTMAIAEAVLISNRILAEDQFVAPLRKLGTPKDKE